METAYGFCGRSGASSTVGTVSGGPYSSPEPIESTTADGHSSRTASSTLAVIATFCDNVAERVLPGLPDVRARGEVVDDVRPRVAHERAHDRGVAQVGDRRRRGGDDLVARGLAGRDEMAAGEPGRAGDEDAAHAAKIKGPGPFRSARPN